MCGVKSISDSMKLEAEELERDALYNEAAIHDDKNSKEIRAAFQKDNKGDDAMMVAGDFNVHLPEEPKAAPPPLPIPPQKSGLLGHLATAAVGAAILGGGFGLSQYLKNDNSAAPGKTEQQPPAEKTGQGSGAFELDR